MKFNYLLFLSFFILPKLSFSQDIKLAAFFIPKELTENANAVIRLDEKNIIIEDFDKIIIQEKQIITVLNKSGDRYLSLTKGYDNNSKITKLSATTYDSSGNRTHKFSKKKFDDYSAAQGLYTDDRVKHLHFSPNRYPYTISIECETKTNTSAFIESWFPVNGYSVSVEKSIYKIQNPKGLTLRTKERNFQGFQIENKSSGENIHLELTNQKAIKHEYYAPLSGNILPNLLVSLNKFSLNGYNANVSNWKEFGTWLRNDLYNSQLALSETTIQKAKDLVKGISDPIEKAKRIYEYVQGKTRYILVAIGIGGWQPAKANEVDRLGYGDCKGLTNYTKALLDVVGVKSHWTIVYAKNKRNIDKKFTSLQGNHMILNIPNNGKDIWLECTSQTIPFGFLGRFTDDRDVLVLTDNGGVIKHTSIYKNETNSQHTVAKVLLDSLGNIKGSVNIISKGIQYGDRYHIIDYTKKEIDKYYKNNYWRYLNNLHIDQYSFNNNKNKIEFKEKINIAANDYASILQKELLFSPNIFNKYTSLPSRYRNREQPLQISTGFEDVDEFTIQLPEKFQASQLPPKTVIKSEFGYYEYSIVKLDTETLQYKRIFKINEGLYEKEAYSKYREFIKFVIKSDNIKIALSKI